MHFFAAAVLVVLLFIILWFIRIEKTLPQVVISPPEKPCDIDFDAVPIEEKTYPQIMDFENDYMVSRECKGAAYDNRVPGSRLARNAIGELITDRIDGVNWGGLGPMDFDHYTNDLYKIGGVRDEYAIYAISPCKNSVRE